MELEKLIRAIPYSQIKQADENTLHIEVQAVEQDSRQVKAGTLFVCIDGEIVDGHAFASKAQEQGAVAIVAERMLPGIAIPIILVEDGKRAMAMLAAAFYNYPTSEMNLIGITGTNGKTTVSHLVEFILSDAHVMTGLIGTMYRKIGTEILETKNTTPDSLTLQKTFRQMREEDVTTAIMEVSSHALVQGRVYGSDYDVAVFTNLSQDHLDYHKTMEEYAHAKSLLFAQLGNGYQGTPKTAIINRDDAHSQMMIDATGVNLLTYGIDNEATFKASNIQISSKGTKFDLHFQGETFSVQLKLIGKFNVYNALAAIATVYAANTKPQAIPDIISSLEKVEGVAGRFELVDAGQQFPVIVDYAHTPDGLENVLKTVCEFAKGRIFVIVGCGGDRDKGKRPQMAQIAVKYATDPIFTSDNPRTEEPMQIIEDMLAGVPEADYTVREHRQDAIQYAVKQANPDDVILIAGKGHETYQIIGDVVHDFNDRVEARAAILAKIL
ncbi:UDP-N-acetylmuramoylalanyl-D-glutamate--2,6-diaminopimelate ligase [Listeria weihenstephanensis FSL R9-0317]|uniref:UDP-N-acetylmuramoyl-L-alanyl-D-glutamate--2,6-diaminopimelate ligase n=1 Tax=Listeria weihenstephanensis TaxID=1006155 RepID=A0A1S7FTJ2_9LIST|nr:UDP-N-acetylmuramoyl-L-alanyl-D-glutamate--2,6-diaminopimelate ligase [Listeria weihenstephanensis]AQY50710.1 UDP-N-acetylmuramoylalanyl-D-glutamate--2,6-diaminopimelate ligase [Listeria weihenstephanensis]EUJ36199.1 UDP-N-acetylmuramoylalanyl-D-glutamate--2,6-diaminopimelate ligase [Listeria weihenstephanensis FSL R9-0317]